MKEVFVFFYFLLAYYFGTGFFPLIPVLFIVKPEEEDHHDPTEEFDRWAELAERP